MSRRPRPRTDPAAVALAAIAEISRTTTDDRSPLDALAALSLLEVGLEDQRHELVGQLRAAGANWSTIGAALGITKQGAHHRYAGTDRTPVPDTTTPLFD
jgi:hypothetical protein